MEIRRRVAPHPPLTRRVTFDGTFPGPPGSRSSTEAVTSLGDRKPLPTPLPETADEQAFVYRYIFIYIYVFDHQGSLLILRVFTSLYNLVCHVPIKRQGRASCTSFPVDIKVTANSRFENKKRVYTAFDGSLKILSSSID